MDRSDIVSTIEHNLNDKLSERSNDLKNLIANSICSYLEQFNQNILCQEKHFSFSIRDILTWTNFINRTCVQNQILSVQEAFRHDAKIVCIDSLGTRNIQRSLEKSKEMSENFLFRKLKN